MIMAKPSDLMTRAYSPRARIQFVQVDVADAARSLEQSHLCGPTASLVLAEALAMGWCSTRTASALDDILTLLAGEAQEAQT